MDNIPEELKNIPNIRKYSPKKAGWGYIYFIVSKKKVIYIGQTISAICNRLSDFKQYKEAEYDEVYHIICPIEKLTKRENQYISEFKPRYNVNYIQLPKVKKKYYYPHKLRVKVGNIEIKDFLKNLEVTQSDLALKLNVTRQAISFMLNTKLSKKSISKIAQVLNIPLHEIPYRQIIINQP